MGKLIVLLIILGVIAAFIYTNQSTESSIKNETQNNQTTPILQSGKIKISSFNIQIFGQTKSQKPEVMDILKKTIDNFDIVAVQEIRDITGSSIFTLLKEINSIQGNNYSVIYSPRLGRSSSKEQYAFYYNPSILSYQSSYTYSDPSDLFEREPFLAKFNSSSFDFVLITIHIKPEDAYNEINALHSVLQDAKSKFPDEGDFIILGDLNADCDYLNEKLDFTLIENQAFVWVVDDSADTTTKSTICTYDRIIFQRNETTEDFTGNWGVFYFDQLYSLNKEQTEAVSDHYPVWAEFYNDHDTN